MKPRDARLKTIKRVIRSERIESQEELLDRLQGDGFQVTQATLSRDLKLLKVGKISDGLHGYYYALPDEEQIMESERQYYKDIVRGYLNLNFSGNLAVMRTLPGHANSVASAFDKITLPEILGSVAGDDTILLVLSEGTTAEDLKQALTNKIPELEL